MPLAVILDMDGLMLDTEPIALRAWREASTELGYDLTDELCDQMIGLNMASSMELLTREFGGTFPADALGLSAVERYRNCLDAGGVPHKAGLQDFIGFLEKRRIPRAVATSTASDLARFLLGRAGVLSSFEIVIGGDQVRRGKPEPDLFLAAAARLGCRPADCLVLEDSGPGIRAAVAAGMTPILIPDCREPSQESRQAAHAVVESLSAARILIERMLDGNPGAHS
jgi:HAD superfamily hydrolase (TIGR01509 family)